MDRIDTYAKLSARTCADPEDLKARCSRPLVDALYTHLLTCIMVSRHLDVLKRELAYGQPHNRQAGGALSADDVEIAQTALNDTENIDLVHAALGLLTEAGEFAESIFKVIFEGKSIDHVHLVEELGDLEFYSAVVRRVLKITDSQVKSLNIKKLTARYPDKFTADAALIRNLEKERDVLEGRD